jgi:hypothetical protein
MKPSLFKNGGEGVGGLHQIKAVISLLMISVNKVRKAPPAHLLTPAPLFSSVKREEEEWA